MKKATSFSFYFLYFAALACLSPFVVLFYQNLGLTGAQIGLLTGLSPLISLVGAPLWTGLADATRRHRLLMSLAVAGAVGGALIFPMLTTFGSILLLAMIFSFVVAPITSFADSATMTMLAGEKEKYGRVRLGGTIGWGLSAPIAGFVIQRTGLHLAFWGYAALMFLAIFVCQRFVFAASTGERIAILTGARRLLADRRWAVFLAMALVAGMGFASVNVYLFPYMQELKASETTMGLALTLSTLSELPVLFFADRLLRRFGARGLFVLAVTITGLRLLLYAAVSAPAGVLVFQLLNGLTFPAAWVAGVTYADQHAPPGMSATAQGIFGAIIFGFGAAAGGLFGGLLLDSIGGRGMFLVFGMTMLVCIAVILLVDRRLEQKGRAR